MSDQNNGLIRIGGLWLNHNRHGEPYWAGSFGMARILVFKANKRSGSNDPDYVICIGERLQQAGAADESDTGDIPF